MRIIFIRHGQTTYNNESRYQGHEDAPLSDLGRIQAAAVAERLKDGSISAIYSSDLSRARETAEAIAAYYGLPVSVNADLRECSFGDWEGLTVSEIRERYPDLYADYQRDSLIHRAPKGERLEDLQARVVKSVMEIADRHPDETVAIVTHGGPIRAFFCYAMDTGLETFRKIDLDNAGITTFSLEPSGRWFLEVLNDTSHLQDLGIVRPGHDETSGSDKNI